MLQRLAGVILGLLLVRCVALLFAVRPDNHALGLLLTISAPLVWPWTWLDRWAGKPLFGAQLELATLAAMVFVATIACVWASYQARRREVEDG